MVSGWYVCMGERYYRRVPVESIFKSIPGVKQWPVVRMHPKINLKYSLQYPHQSIYRNTKKTKSKTIQLAGMLLYYANQELLLDWHLQLLDHEVTSLTDTYLSTMEASTARNEELVHVYRPDSAIALVDEHMSCSDENENSHQNNLTLMVDVQPSKNPLLGMLSPVSPKKFSNIGNEPHLSPTRMGQSFQSQDDVLKIHTILPPIPEVTSTSPTTKAVASENDTEHLQPTQATSIIHNDPVSEIYSPDLYEFNKPPVSRPMSPPSAMVRTYSTDSMASMSTVTTSTVTAPVFKRNPVMDEINYGISCIHENSPDVTELNVTDVYLSPSQLKLLFESLPTNSHLKKLVLENVGMQTVTSQQLSTALIKNKSIVFLNISRNQIGPDGIKQFAYLLADNHTLKQLNLTHQKNVTSHGSETEQIFVDTINRNKTIVKLGLVFKNKSCLERVDRALVRNNDIMRRQKQSSFAVPHHRHI
ncbi:hypothetical protein BC833DRAFT_584581 [Globomyces pollinis-pini]|nr:hypothetical protein BC833DRAFT_584581 [Globomyces pollinis-pini]